MSGSVTTPTTEFLSPISPWHLSLNAGAATWREALEACSRCARGIQFRTRRTRRRCQVALHTQRAARTLLPHPARRPTPHLQRVGLTDCGRLPLHRSIRKSCALDTYETTETISYHHTIRQNPRQLLEMRWESCKSRTPRCSWRCCCCCTLATRGRRWRRRCGCGEAAPTRGRPQWSTVGPQAAGGAAPPTFARVSFTFARRRGVDRRFGASTRGSRSA